MSDRRMSTLRRTFKNLDTNGDNQLSFSELEKAFDSDILSEQELLEILLKADTDYDGKISLEEFETAMETFFKPTYSESEVAEIFSTIDKNKDGLLSYREIIEVLKVFRDEKTTQNVLNLIAEFDFDDDGYLDIDDFSKFLNHQFI